MSWDWLPDRQLHVVETLGHVDTRIAELHRRVLAYTGLAIEHREVRLRGRFRLEVAAINPVPAIISRLTADVFNGLRAALEHTLVAEAAATAGRSLTPEEERAIEFPLTRNVSQWASNRHRKSNPALAPDGTLLSRITTLQPVDDERHPLRLLVEYSNLTKHRLPAVVATHQAAVTIVDRVTGAISTERRPRPISLGDVIAEANNVAEVDTFAYVALERPHTHETVILMAEIAAIEAWVREEAVPTLIAGAPQSPPIPPAFPVDVGHRERRSAMESVKNVPSAAIRGQNLAGHAIMRVGLTEMLSQRAIPEQTAAIKSWVETLDFDATKRRLERLEAAAQHGQEEEAARQVIRIAVKFAERSTDPADK